MTSLRLPAPAKLNLFLHITGQREDGYHDLQTVFQLLDFGDTIELRTRADGRIGRTRAIVGVTEDEDITLRAGRVLQQEAGTSLGVDIGVEKRLPLGGGLGGGSSDAATVLHGLNRLWKLGLDNSELARVGLTLGADVPVFVTGESAWAEGIGEELRPMALTPAWFLVVDPGVRVPTAAIFGASELTRNTAPVTIRDLLPGGHLEHVPELSPDALLEHTGNDCEPVVRSLYPQVGRALDWLAEHGQARMTGTGGCVFACFATREEAEQAMADRPGGCDAFVARGVNRSPLLARVQQT